FLAAGDHLVDAERQAEAGLVLAELARFDHILDIMKVQLSDPIPTLGLLCRGIVSVESLQVILAYLFVIE
ncbi:hypothetical protein ACCS72_37910, partial [Rhizobium ruizarguesonis]